MLITHLRGVASFVRTLARIAYRNAELKILCWVAKRRVEEVRKLAVMVGLAFEDRTPLVSGIFSGFQSGMGYDTNSAGKRITGLCWNAPISVVVYIDDLPYFGLGLELRGSVLCIRQMQGLPGAIPPKKLPDWPELFVKCCVLYAETAYLRQVRVYKADQDITFDSPAIVPEASESYEVAVRKHQDRMRRRYDRTAAKLKFKKQKRYYVWENPDYKPRP